jgi:hypothetical protein
MRLPTHLMASKRAHVVIVALAATGIALGGFETGRSSVDAAAIARTTEFQSPAATLNPSPRFGPTAGVELNSVTFRDIATVPFSELYDVLEYASRQQLLAWARDLDHMPRGPRQRAAINAYYKSLVQVDHHAAIDAVMHSENLNMREIALDALTKAAPESIWGELAQMTIELPYPIRGNTREDIIWNWSAVDPVAAAHFIEDHPVTGEDQRLFSLMCNWGAINPEQARDWLDADPSRQTEDAFRALVSGWADNDWPGAMQYVLANVKRPEFARAIDELTYRAFRNAKDEATRLILLLPTDHAKGAVQSIADMTTTVILGLPDGYQRPPEEAARWMITLPPELWNNAIGNVTEGWLKRDAASATSWLDQLQPNVRDAVIAGLCRSAHSESAQEVLALGQSIGDPKLRDAALGQFVRNLSETKEEALEAINGFAISEDAKTYLRKVMAEESNGR